MTPALRLLTTLLLSASLISITGCAPNRATSSAQARASMDAIRQARLAAAEHIRNLEAAGDLKTANRVSLDRAMAAIDQESRLRNDEELRQEDRQILLDALAQEISESLAMRDRLKRDSVRRISIGTTLEDALGLLSKDDGYFVVQSRDEVVAFLHGFDVSTIVFDRPEGVARPDVIATETPETIAMMGRIPLDALPEFVNYKVASKQ